MKEFFSQWWPPSKTVLAAVAALAVFALVVVIAIAVTGKDAPEENLVASESSATPTPEPTEDETVAEEEVVPTPPMATVPPDVPKYCDAWKSLGASAKISLDDDEGIDLPELGKVFKELHDHYDAAHDSAPPSLRGDYSMVLGYLAQAQKAIKSRDTDEIKIMITNLGVLNPAMDKIEKDSRRLCT